MRRFRTLVALNSLLTAVGVVGMTRYISTSSEFWPSIVYFVTLCVVGSITAITPYIRRRSFQRLAVGFNTVSVALLAVALIAAFVVSPGSGVMAFVFVFFPLVINVTSLKSILHQARQT